MPNPAVRIDKSAASATLRTDYPHIGLLDVHGRRLFIARRPDAMPGEAIRAAHASLLIGGAAGHGVAAKDRFVCYWFHTPRTGSGLLQGYPIEWDEGHLMVRLDPHWDYRNQRLLRSTDARAIERNIEQQYEWGAHVFHAYCTLRPRFALSWHLIGPRPSDSMFYVARFEA